MQTDENAIDITGQDLDLSVLVVELQQADIPAEGLATAGDQLWMFDTGGEVIDPTPEAEAVVDAHVPPPKTIDYAGAVTVDSVIRTTDDQPTPVFRFPTETKHVYRGTFRMTAVDAASGATRDSEVRMVFKHAGTSLSQVGTTTVLSNVQDTAASSWRIQPSVQGTDLVLTVTGAAGRTIDWILTGEVAKYAPEGLPQ